MNCKSLFVFLAVTAFAMSSLGVQDMSAAEEQNYLLATASKGGTY